jgi:hypothetical protein
MIKEHLEHDKGACLRKLFKEVDEGAGSRTMITRKWISMLVEVQVKLRSKACMRSTATSIRTR